MPLTTAGKNLILNAAAGVNPPISMLYASLHSAIPGDAGSSELSGGSYARVSIAWLAAASGSMSKSATNPVFAVPAGSTVGFSAFWSALTSGTCIAWSSANGGTVNGVAVVASSGNLFTSPGHGLVTNNRGYFSPCGTAAFPSGLDQTVLYYIIGASTNTFQVSLTQGGAAVTVGTDGVVAFQEAILEVFGSANPMTLNAATIDLNA